MIWALLRYLLITLVAFIMAGVILKVKAMWGGRYGQPFLQPFYDFIKLIRKSAVISTTVSPVFHMAPAVGLATALTAAMVIPVGGERALISFSGDFLFFAYVLACGKFFLVLGAFDTGSSFEGMGASRELTFNALIEPAFFIIMGSLAMLTGKTSFSEIYGAIPSGAAVAHLAGDLGVGFWESISATARAWSHSPLLIPAICGNFVLMITIIVEAARMPVDDPTTHLELTMIHEVMALDYSGPDLSLINLTAMLKMSLYGTLITGLIIPSWVSHAAGIFLYVFLMILIALTVGLVESLTARLRMTHVPQFILGATSIALVVLAVLLLGGLW